MAQGSGTGEGPGVGDPAPAFTLAAINRQGDIGLADYHGRQSLLLGLFRGLHCPFCRRQVAQMNRHSEQLSTMSVAPLAVINTDLAHAKLYYGKLGFEMALAVDPDWDTHRRYGLTRTRMVVGKTDWPKKANILDVMRLPMGPDDGAPKPMSMFRASAAMDRVEGYKPRLADKAGQVLNGLTNSGYILIDRDGIVRSTWIEGVAGLDDFFKFPSPDKLIDTISQALR